MTTEEEVKPLSQAEFDKLVVLEKKATPGPWRWWTSCSFRRLSSDATGKDGDVLRAVLQRWDGHPDVHASEDDKALIAAVRNALPALLAEVVAFRKLRAMFDAPGAELTKELVAEAEAGSRYAPLLLLAAQEVVESRKKIAALEELLSGARTALQALSVKARDPIDAAAFAAGALTKLEIDR